ncbi:hypothetical protein J6590_032626 [Homalodisca vitripennis]|nr:hypothetical protein J6590_032626 [Homalodisca vitripennis]
MLVNCQHVPASRIVRVIRPTGSLFDKARVPYNKNAALTTHQARKGQNYKFYVGEVYSNELPKTTHPGEAAQSKAHGTKTPTNVFYVEVPKAWQKSDYFKGLSLGRIMESKFIPVIHS